MSMDATVWAFKQRNLPALAKLCLLILADCYDPANGGHIGIAYLCEELEVTPDKAVYVIGVLATEGLIKLRIDECAAWPDVPLRFDMPIED